QARYLVRHELPPDRVGTWREQPRVAPERLEVSGKRTHLACLFARHILGNAINNLRTRLKQYPLSLTQCRQWHIKVVQQGIRGQWPDIPAVNQVERAGDTGHRSQSAFRL